jgi:hypothetical protein
MPEGRIIEILWKKERGYYTNIRTPDIFHACSGSRREALKQYTAIEFENQYPQTESEAPAAELNSASAAPDLRPKIFPPFGTYFDYYKLYLFIENYEFHDNAFRDDNDFLSRLAPKVRASLQGIIVREPAFCAATRRSVIS